jgi:hypothetical protein
VLLVSLLLSAAVFGTGLAFGNVKSAGMAGLFAVLIALPASTIYICDVGWPRMAAWCMVGALVLIGAPSILAIMLAVKLKGLHILLLLPIYLSLRAFPWAVLISQFAANYLMNAEVRS